MIINVKKLTDTAVIPTKGTEFSAGRDLYADIQSAILIPSGETVKIPTGIALEIPVGYAGLVCARSGMATKEGLAPANKVGVIDADYRGEVIVFLHNHGKETRTVEPGQRIAQLVVTPFLDVDFNETEILSPTERGKGGFGSTGKK